MAKQSVIADPQTLSDGLLRFQVKPLGDGEAVVHELDVLLLKLACEECESKHGLKVVEGRVRPTTDFLRDLAAKLETLGVVGCSASVAYQLWCEASDAIALLKKNTSETPNLPSGSTFNRTGRGRKGKSRKGKR